jgi:putative NADH-flavin reductase
MSSGKLTTGAGREDRGVRGDRTDGNSPGAAGTRARLAGHVKGSPSDLQQRAIALILDAMRAAGVDRLLTLTGAGVRHPDDRPKMVDKVFGAALKLLQAELLADSEAYVRVVLDSGLHWTIVRAPRLTDDPGRGSYRVTRIARADVAQFILDELDTNAYVGAMPVVSW